MDKTVLSPVRIRAGVGAHHGDLNQVGVPKIPRLDVSRFLLRLDPNPARGIPISMVREVQNGVKKPLCRVKGRLQFAPLQPNLPRQPVERTRPGGGRRRKRRRHGVRRARLEGGNQRRAKPR